MLLYYIISYYIHCGIFLIQSIYQIINLCLAYKCFCIFWTVIMENSSTQTSPTEEVLYKESKASLIISISLISRLHTLALSSLLFSSLFLLLLLFSSFFSSLFSSLLFSSLLFSSLLVLCVLLRWSIVLLMGHVERRGYRLMRSCRVNDSWALVYQRDR